ncbi:MAG: phosphodiester glycosidase family protein [Anaerolineales bacterium]
MTNAHTPTMDISPTWTPAAEEPEWERLRAGLERRTILVTGAALEVYETVTAVRIDPQYFFFDVAYDPLGMDLEAWQRESGADVVVNGGYFRMGQDIFLPDGLIVVGGKPMGESYGEYAGMFAVGEGGPELRRLSERPYDPREPLRAALQSFPILIRPGGSAGFPESADDGIAARRTVIGQDRQGRILFLLADRGHFTLRALSLFLESSGLGLDIAMNLDGGPSSGMLIRQPLEILPARYILPIVITATAK